MVRIWWLVLVLVAPLLAVGVTTGTTAVAGAAAESASPSPVRVASVNLREGSLLRLGRDRRTGHDLAVFARRLLSRPGPTPDVVLLQEVLGTASRAAAALNTVQRDRGRAGRYAVVTTTDRFGAGGGCDGSRPGRFTVLRSSAILVDTTTVTDVSARGVVRTWGRWGGAVPTVAARGGFGCTEHPWVRLEVAAPGGPRTATVLNVHAAPRGSVLKTRAIGTLRRSLQTLTRAVPTDVAVLGGDFNLSRCGRGLRVERPGCHVRPVHRALVNAGFRDAVRDRLPSGPGGVAGVSRRIDFLYVRGVVSDAWWDRCYQAYRVTRWRCGARAAFTAPGVFVACQARAQGHRGAGGRCAPASFRRYYSDHPVLTAAVG